MKINSIVRLAIIAASLICSILPSIAQSEGLTFDIIEPAVNSIITKAPINIQISFHSPIDVKSVEVYLNEKLLVTGNLNTPMPNGHFPLSADYRRLNLIPGKYFLQVKLIDILGKSANRTVAITLQNNLTAEKNPPTVSITNPKDGTVIEKDQDVQITVDANDDSGIKWVMVYFNDKARAVMNIAPYIAPWNPMRESFEAGSYIITARAIDLFENTAISKPIKVVFAPGGNTTYKPVNAQPFDQIGSGVPLLPTLGAIYNRFSSAELLNKGWASGIPTGLPSMMANADNRVLMAMANNTGTQQFLIPMRIAPENINETIAGSPVMALAMAPALTAFPGMINPMSVNGYSYTPLYTALPVPTGEAISRNTLSESPLLTGNAVNNKTATPTTIKKLTVTTAQTVAQQPGINKVNVPEQKVVMGKGKFTGTPTALGAKDLTTSRTTELTNPLMIAKLPDKIATGVDTSKAVKPSDITASTGVTPAMKNDNIKPAIVASGQIAPTRSSVAISDKNGAARSVASELPMVKGSSNKISPQATTAAPSVRNIIAQASNVVPANPTVTVNQQTTTGQNVTTRGTVGNPTAAAAANRNTTTLNPDIKTVSQNRMAVPKTTSRNPESPKITLKTVTIDVYANYITVKGDTPKIIAMANNISEAELIKVNPDLNPKSAIPVGTNIKIKQSPAKLYVDDNPITGYPMPMLVNGATLIPLRAVVEAKDGTVVWLEKTREVNAWLAENNAFMKVKIGDKNASINNQKVTLKNAPRIEKSRAMIEVEYLITAMNLKYEYNPTSNTYYFVSKK